MPSSASGTIDEHTRTHVGPQAVDRQLALPLLPGRAAAGEGVAVLAAEFGLVAHGEDVEIEVVRAAVALPPGRGIAPRRRAAVAVAVTVAVAVAVAVAEREGRRRVVGADDVGTRAAAAGADEARRARDEEEEECGDGEDRPGGAGGRRGRRGGHRGHDVGLVTML